MPCPARRSFGLAALAAVVLLLMTTALPRPAAAGDKADAREVLAKAVASVERVRTDANFKRDMEPFLARARAVLVVPSFYKGAFFVGGAYGNGVLTVRNDAGQFSPPAFFRLIGGSVGLQIGGQEAEMIFMIMTDKGLDAILRNKFKIGAGAGVSFATFGANVEAATTSALDADVIAFAHADGAFGGGAIEGTVIETRSDWNRAVYGAGATTKAILFDRRYPPPADAEALFQALTVGTGAPSPSAQTAPSEDTGAGATGAAAAEPEPSVETRPVRLAPVESAPLDPPPSQ